MEQTQKLKKAKEKPHYVDNKKFLQAMIEYRDRCSKAEEKGSSDFSPLWCGQNATGCKEISATELTIELARGIT